VVRRQGTLESMALKVKPSADLCAFVTGLTGFRDHRAAPFLNGPTMADDRRTSARTGEGFCQSKDIVHVCTAHERLWTAINAPWKGRL